MGASGWKDEMKRLKSEIDNASGSRKESLKAEYYDAYRKYEKALAEEAKAKYQEAYRF
jgi:hypothetical protein